MNKLLDCIDKHNKSYIPIWFMTSYRYLPEFREIRKQNQDLLNYA